MNISHIVKRRIIWILTGIVVYAAIGIVFSNDARVALWPTQQEAKAVCDVYFVVNFEINFVLLRKCALKEDTPGQPYYTACYYYKDGSNGGYCYNIGG
jgi:hypothetical protein